MSGTLSKQNEIVDILKRAGGKGCTNVEMSKVAIRYGGYLGNLYQLGYVIEKEYLGNGIFNYVLVNEPEDDHVPIQQSAFEKLVGKVEEKVFVSSKELVEIMSEIGLSVRYKSGTHQNH